MRKNFAKYLRIIILSYVIVPFISCDNLDLTSSQADSFFKVFGSWDSDYGTDVKSFNNGYIILATMTNTEDSNTDICLIKTDKYGNPNADTDTLDSGGDDIASKLLLTSDGGYVIIGTFEDTATNKQDIVVAKYNSQYEQEWIKTIGTTTSDEQGISIKESQSGYIIVGNTNKADPLTENPAGTWDIYMVKIDDSGNTEWVNNFGADGADKASEIITINQGYLVVGISDSFNESGQGGDDIIAIKTNLTGGETDKFTYGSIYDDMGNSVVEVSDGFVIVGSVENISGGNSDVYVVKVEKDDLQHIIWNKSYGDNLNDIGYDILKTDNGFTIIGSHGNISGSYAYFFTIDSEGNSTSEQLYGGYDQVLYSFEQTSDAGYIMVGSSGQAGNEQICLIKVNAEGTL